MGKVTGFLEIERAQPTRRKPDERIKDFYDKMVKAGVLAADLDYKKIYTLAFVNKGVGLDQKPK